MHYHRIVCLLTDLSDSQDPFQDRSVVLECLCQRQVLLSRWHELVTDCTPIDHNNAIFTFYDNLRCALNDINCSGDPLLTLSSIRSYRNYPMSPIRHYFCKTL